MKESIAANMKWIQMRSQKPKLQCESTSRRRQNQKHEQKKYSKFGYGKQQAWYLSRHLYAHAHKVEC